MNALQQAANVKTPNEAIVFAILGAVCAGLVASGKVEPEPGQSAEQAVDNMVATAPEWAKTAIRMAVMAGAGKANDAAARGLNWGPTGDMAQLLFMVTMAGDDLAEMPM